MVRIRPYKLKVMPLQGKSCLVWKYINTARPTYLMQLETRQLKKLVSYWYKNAIIKEEHYKDLLKFDTLIHFFDDKLGYFVAMSTPTTELWNIWLKDLNEEMKLVNSLNKLFGIEDIIRDI